jgi:hypothetical protein
MSELDDVKTYLSGTMSDAFTDDALQGALDAEKDDQARRLRAGVVVTDHPALVEALHRRVARNLALRALPLGIATGEDSAIRVGFRDPEIRRLESPYRRVTVG